MIKRKPYFKKSTDYVSFEFDSEQEATVFREYASLMGMRTDIEAYNDKYKKVVYIFVDYRE